MDPSDTSEEMFAERSPLFVGVQVAPLSAETYTPFPKEPAKIRPPLAVIEYILELDNPVEEIVQVCPSSSEI
ncbi:MAG: hypothetical protein BWY67_02262 [Bacteroidetes bacterium ADurb.Bin397]|nr:MAG: hypothetical protein BWY67_02262 [Bacteroidetes bacterium ADurb.Bin397]